MKPSDDGQERKTSQLHTHQITEVEQQEYCSDEEHILYLSPPYVSLSQTPECKSVACAQRAEANDETGENGTISETLSLDKDEFSNESSVYWGMSICS